jgi:superfamily I DNA/RNA helicase
MTQKHKWSDYQKAIFSDIANGSGHTIVIARAGSAKTSSIVEGAKYIPRGKTSLFCAFNKSIQEELKQKLPSYCECLTLHSLGFRAIKKHFVNVEVNNNKCFEIVETLINSPKENYDLINNICRTVSFCKATLSDTPSKVEDIIIDYDIDICDLDIDKFVQIVLLALRRCKEDTKQIDYDDMIYFPFVYGLNVGKFDIVFIDECQDLNTSQIILALSAVKKDGRIIAVLDNFQAIYSWRGADSKILDRLRDKLKPKELSLPICYRCPKKIVNLVKKYVPDIQEYENAKDGEIIHISPNELEKYAKPGSYVLSRTNAPLIKYCLSFLKKGIPSNILGKDIGNGLYYLIKKSKKKRVNAFLKWIYNWASMEKKRILARYPKANVEFIDDKVECMKNLCEGTNSLEQVKENIEKLFKDNDENNIVLFSSIHKIKGKESNVVFVLADTLKDSSQEEINIKYVSFTRSKEKLYLVSTSKSNNYLYNKNTEEMYTV